ncbi:alpha/beta fold hydrolase [Bacillus sp. FJAT-42376]|uniref:alpha/beta fold hydrolase n=1 Tax=Bacillus sp. FJAT-42376 TaxID=2014076 RepID=UPI000F4FF9F9|nr:alpha/beta fold hydrolase [Bacillus sp. FJAT-42376]AZB44366.1 alpha/beta fold hydrolase [Bacillus sp. FJAT-42376]
MTPFEAIYEQVKKCTLLFQTPEPPVGLTEKTAVWKKNKATLWYYPAPEKKSSVPLFLIYSLVNKAFILDLAPGYSMIEAFVNEGYDVYLLDFGVPGYEDKDLTIESYVLHYVQEAARRTLRHSQASELTVIGYCLGGTIAAIYAAMTDDPIRNLILNVAPIDFHQYKVFDEITKGLANGEADLDPLFDALGIIPAPFMKTGLRAVSYPIYYSPYLSLIYRIDNKEYTDYWRRFNKWTQGHIPFSGGAIKQLVSDFGRENKLIRGGLIIGGKNASLSNISCPLLVICAESDKLVPMELSTAVIDLVSSQDKTLHVLKGGHATFTVNNGLPEYLGRWLSEHSL